MGLLRLLNKITISKIYLDVFIKKMYQQKFTLQLP